MYSAIETRFAEALKTSSLSFTPGREIRRQYKGVNVIFTLAAGLQKKPSCGSQAGNAGSPRSKSPWVNPDPNLLVEQNDRYMIMLNKFAVTKYHFLLVTKVFEPQESPLSESDWGAALDVLCQANAESGRRHIGFFNCGPASGASVAHKHIQFMTLPEDFVPFPDSTASEDKDVYANENVPFAHYIQSLPVQANAEQAAMVYSNLLGHTLTLLARHELPLSYNIVFTEQWMMITPRSAESYEGISINALGTTGLLLAKSEKDLALLEKEGFEIIKKLGLPYEPVMVRFMPDHTGYTRY